MDVLWLSQHAQCLANHPSTDVVTNRASLRLRVSAGMARQCLRCHRVANLDANHPTANPSADNNTLFPSNDNWADHPAIVVAVYIPNNRPMPRGPVLQRLRLGCGWQRR